jgi:hypothetical protein
MNKFLVALGIALAAPGIALGQSLKEQIVGTWRLVSIYNEANGTKTNLYGEKPLGLLVFDKSGNVISMIAKPDIPKFATPNRLKGTDAEYRAVVQGIIAGFGTYSVEGDTVSIKTVASSYPNRSGTTEKRTYKVSGDDMTTVNPTAASGGSAHSKYVRVK